MAGRPPSRLSGTAAVGRWTKRKDGFFFWLLVALSSLNLSQRRRVSWSLERLSKEDFPRWLWPTLNWTICRSGLDSSENQSSSRFTKFFWNAREDEKKKSRKGKKRFAKLESLVVIQVETLWFPLVVEKINAMRGSHRMGLFECSCCWLSSRG